MNTNFALSFSHTYVGQVSYFLWSTTTKIVSSLLKKIQKVWSRCCFWNKEPNLSVNKQRKGLLPIQDTGCESLEKNTSGTSLATIYPNYYLLTPPASDCELLLIQPGEEMEESMVDLDIALSNFERRESFDSIETWRSAKNDRMVESSHKNSMWGLFSTFREK